MEKLIIIRGPSGSGKSSVAEELHKHCSRPTLLVSEDRVRRMFSDWKEPNHTSSKEMATVMVIAGLTAKYDVIYEGIANIKTYRQYFDEIFTKHPSNNFLFYLDVSFDETVRRHDMRPQKSEFTVEEMKEWWDYASPTGYESETVIPEASTLADTVATIGRVANIELGSTPTV